MLRCSRELMKIHIPLSRVQRLFSRGSGNGGQNLHASNSRCLLKFNINETGDWLPLKIREIFISQYGQYISPRGTVVIVREDTRSAKDNEKLAIGELQSLLDKCEEIAADERPPEPQFETELERVKASRSAAQQARYKNRLLEEKRLRSEVKRNRRIRFED